ncbi:MULTISPECIES: bacitracin resistance protein [unclassified Microbacterium]|uniref:bacitracin resistance protein n=1 Tax=unclassified Microbacterium TaxID=2609290 RepID=UPI00214BFB29|nr:MULTISPECIES: bacitracin resistance protein [unclassified Microbacterium]MCR2784581.1 bacitracin resistance protein [Microbacterium sp. zg.B96]MDL5350500.1 bacitracin resistance protein [Microbacterium sp. zg-YB36]WIM14610.1 bacitracin resistance protein [Microbacterium sp. zg-B96]
MTAETPTATPAPARRTALPMWLVTVIAGVFLVLYAFVFWTALGFLMQQAGGVAGLTGYGWFVLLLPVIFAPAVFAAAFAIGWRRRALPYLAVMLTGLAFVAVFWLDVLAYAAVTTALFGA